MSNDARPSHAVRDPARVVPEELTAGRRPVTRPELLKQAREILALVVPLLDDPGVAHLGTAADLPSADAALARAEGCLTERLEDGGRTQPLPADTGAALAAGLIQVKTVRGAIMDKELAARTGALTDVQGALERLRSARSVSELIEQACVEISRIGYYRGMISTLYGPHWVTQAAFNPDDPANAEALVALSKNSPGRIGREQPETDLIRRRRPVVVYDALNSPQVHRGLVTLANTRDYVAAPLVAGGYVVGVLHADREDARGTLSEVDCALLGLFAEGLGLAYERTLLQERLGALKRQLEDQAKSVDDLLGQGAEPRSTQADGSGWDTHPALQQPAGPLAHLTRREFEVLCHLADGQSNAQIAMELYVSPGTVKTHVKNILRKLGAASRAEAASRYHRLAQTGG